ncbi:unnamed protein product [Dovyalis caffra]|uniref:RRM domain-containing protein n=1 Tax=Dovyalis caffra TaxID=77055 RepID=A0AAV1SDX0_9ROSI|nr:unnamed protein product [Dovyalis caffra]
MAEGTEIEERVDLDEDNYMEEIDDDVEDQLDEDGEDDAGDAHAEENVEEEYEDSKTEGSQKDQSPEADRSPANTDLLEDEQKPTASVNEEEKQKHAQLLALPPHGSEVFIGGLPKDVIEDDLRDLCKPIGEIFEIRLMKDKDTGESKCFAFVAFKSKEVARKATEELHSKDYKGKTLRCSISETKNRLFIGNVPKNLMEDEFRKVIEEVGPGVEVIELIKLDGHTPTVSWADPKGTPPDHSAAASQVKALYVKNIPENTSTEKLKELFQRHGDVTKVVMPPGKAGKRDFGFIHYAERSSALKAVRDTEKYEIDGVDVNWNLGYLKDPNDSETKDLLFITIILVHPLQLASDMLDSLLLVANMWSGPPRLKDLFMMSKDSNKISWRLDMQIFDAESGINMKRLIYVSILHGHDSALGQLLEVVLAKPQADKKPDGAYPYNTGVHPNPVPLPAYSGFAGNPYGSMGSGFGAAAGFQQPVIYGRGPMPAGMHMVPMVLPDGRIGYVLQQPGVQMPQPRARRVDRGNGPSGPGRAESIIKDALVNQEMSRLHNWNSPAAYFNTVT